MTHLFGLLAVRLEDACLALIVRLTLWRQQHAPETCVPTPAESAAARMAETLGAVVWMERTAYGYALAAHRAGGRA